MPAWGGGKASTHGRGDERLCREGKWKNKSVQKQTWLKTESCSNEFHVLLQQMSQKRECEGD